MKIQNKFLGRTYDVNNDGWVHIDGSGGFMPDELRKEILNDNQIGEGRTAMALGRLFEFKRDNDL